MSFLRSERKNQVLFLQMDRGKVNAINHEMVQEMRKHFEEAKNDPEIRGVILTGKPDYFSAGLDVVELAHYEYDQIKAFWLDFFGMFSDLIRFPKPFISAISGHSPAGGTVIALTADIRLMAKGDKYLIGLNEIAVNIPITGSIFEVYSFWLGKRMAYQALFSGRLFSVDEASQVGLIDEVVELDQLDNLAERKMSMLLRPNDYILTNTKLLMRRELIQKTDVKMTDEIEERARYWKSDLFQKELEKFVSRLKSK